jgi:AAHS family 4-hydroxybenzoate transporter-like MFS transporter
LLSLGWPVRDIVLTSVVPAGAAILALAALSLVGRRAVQTFPDSAVAEN